MRGRACTRCASQYPYDRQARVYMQSWRRDRRDARAVEDLRRKQRHALLHRRWSIAPRWTSIDSTKWASSSPRAGWRYSASRETPPGRSLPCNGSDRVAQGRVEEKRPVSPRSCATSVGKIRVPRSPSRLMVVPGSMRRGGTLTTAPPTRHFRTRPVSPITRTSSNFICCVSSNIAVPSRHWHDRVVCVRQREYFYVALDAGPHRPVSGHAPGTSLAVAGTGYIMPAVHVGI